MSRRLRVAAALLLLLFSLKKGTGLLLHEVFHSGLAGASNATAVELHLACNCIDDFNTPVHEPGSGKETTPAVFTGVFPSELQPALHAYFVPLIDLRGPPAGTA